MSSERWPASAALGICDSGGWSQAVAHLKRGRLPTAYDAKLFIIAAHPIHAGWRYENSLSIRPDFAANGWIWITLIAASPYPGNVRFKSGVSAKFDLASSI